MLRASRIDDHLYLGDSIDGSSLKWAEEEAISVIINMCEESYTALFPKLASYHHFPVPDHPKTNILTLVGRTSAIIAGAASEGRRVLVHCGEGVSRAPTIVLAHLISEKRMSLVDAVLLLHSMRPIIDPNNGFMRQLQRLEVEMLGETSWKEGGFADDWGWGCREILKEFQQPATT